MRQRGGHGQCDLALRPVGEDAVASHPAGDLVTGTYLALKHGCAFVRQVFLLLPGVLILKFAWDTLLFFH